MRNQGPDHGVGSATRRMSWNERLGEALRRSDRFNMEVTSLTQDSDGSSVGRFTVAEFTGRT